MTWQVIIAVIGAWFIAIGAAAQEQPTTAASGHAVGRFELVKDLLRSRRWMTGALITTVGMVLHLAALMAAPLTIIQPLGISGLLVAVWVAARWRGRRLTAFELLAAAAVTVGLSGLVIALPREEGAVPTSASDQLLILTAVIVPLSLGVMYAAAWLGPRWRAWLFAATAGLCFGVTAALARLIATQARADLTALWHWRSIAVLVVAATGGLILQNAYRSGHFGLAYATLLIADPVVAAGLGIVFLNEALPDSGATATTAALAAAVTVAGVVGLARSAAPGASAGAGVTSTFHPPDVDASAPVNRPASSTKEIENVPLNASCIGS